MFLTDGPTSFTGTPLYTPPSFPIFRLQTNHSYFHVRQAYFFIDAPLPYGNCSQPTPCDVIRFMDVGSVFFSLYIYICCYGTEDLP